MHLPNVEKVASSNSGQKDIQVVVNISQYTDLREAKVKYFLSKQIFFKFQAKVAFRVMSSLGAFSTVMSTNLLQNHRITLLLLYV